MKPNDKGLTLNGSQKKPNIFLIFLLVILLLGAIGLGLYTIMTQQLSTKSRAEDVASDSATLDETASPTPAAEVAEPTPESSSLVETVTPTVAESVTESSSLVETVTPTVAESAGESASESATTAVTTVPTQALVSSLSCPANGAICAWDAVSGATGYNVSVVDTTTSDVLIKRTVSSTSVNFTPIINHTYTCSVTAQNDCGVSGLAVAENTCRSNVTPTVTPQVTPGPSATPGPGPSATPGPSGTVIVQSVTGGAAPTIPSAGSSSTVYFMVIATILVATLFLVF